MLVRNITELPLEKMQHGLAKPIARIRLEPDEITSKTGIQFTRAEDDLGELEAALIATQSGKQFALVRHRHQPLPGTDFVAREGSEDPTADLMEGMYLLGIGPTDLTWIHPDIDETQVAFRVH